MTTTKEHDERMANMTFATVYPHYVEVRTFILYVMREERQLRSYTLKNR